MNGTIKLDYLNALFPPVNYSLITFDDLESPRLVALYTVFWDVSLIFTTIFFYFMLYMIIKKSPKEMSDYKWYLVHQLTWSYLFDLYLGLWKPVPLWPFYLGYSAGIFANTVGNYTTIQLLIACFFAIGMGFSVFISIMHRAMQASPLSNFYKHYSCLWVRITVYILVFILLIAVLIVPLFLFSFSIQTNLKGSLTSKYPELVRLFELHPSIFGYDTTFAQYSVGYGCLIIIVLICVIIIAVAAYSKLVSILKRNKAHLSAGTYKLQVMLFKALFIQLLLAGILLVFPITLCLILTLLGFRGIASYSLLAIFFTGTHASVDFTVLCYYVRSYRMYIKSLLQKLLRKIGFNIPENTPPLVAVSTTVENVNHLH